MSAEYTYYIVTGVTGLMVAALAWFIKRLLTELEGKIAQSEKSARDRMDALEKRMDRQESRYDMLLAQLPEKYALRDDLIRMGQNIESQLSQIRDLIVGTIRENKGNP